MPRAKNRVASRARRKKILKATSGQFGKRKNSIAIAKDAFYRGGKYAYRDRRDRKRQFRALWIIRINAAAREQGLSYSAFISGLKKKTQNARSSCPARTGGDYQTDRAGQILSAFTHKYDDVSLRHAGPDPASRFTRK
jgi:large subunit ribosomal protein L20